MTGQSILLVVGALVGVIAMITLAARFLQSSGWPSGWRGHHGTERTLILQESIALDPRRRIHLVRCGRQQVMLLTGGGQDLVVGWVQDQ